VRRDRPAPETIGRPPVGGQRRQRPRRRLLSVVMTTLALAVAANVVRAETVPREQFDPDTALKVSQGAIGRPVGDYSFTTTLNRRVRLAEFRGKPLIINLVYSGCADICPTVSETLADAVEVAQSALGQDSFHVVTIGFDSRHDTPQRMHAYARSHGLSLGNWDFLSGDAAAIDGIAEDLGFLFFAAPQGFDHVAQTTIIDPDGRVYRHIYGATFDPPLLVEPLKDLVWNRRSPSDGMTGLVNQIRFLCTVYDPASGRYRFNYSIFISIGLVGLALAATLFIIVRAWLRERRMRAV
jgi:protein SCO1/2